MTTDHDEVTTRFDRFRATTPMAGPGAPEARALGARQKRRGLITVAAVLLVLTAISAVILRPGQAPDRLTPATDQAPADWKQTVRNARLDLRDDGNGNCTGPVVQFHDGTGTARDPIGDLTTYTIESRYPMLTADIDRDGRVDYLVSVGCRRVPQPGDPGTPSTIGVMQLFVLRGTPENLTSIGGIRAMTTMMDPSQLHLTIRPDGLIRIEQDNDPGYILIWGYRNGHMEVIKRWVTPTK
ncbi:hypothetical protein [Cryptosporangium phraense]|uniref:Uncharacterized protein n=1 Tax=Cryptosporangium phraense TaxID=2593070 RepID=A0A545ASC5_9ACTN|nr:hypothetical protein [Cryptosporangium phraense]TQS44219.1 hypothetical protein FL583_14845 [Cryptosporangium phraense]